MTWLSNRHYHLGALVLAGSVFLSSSALAALPASAQKQLNGAVFNYNRGFVQKAIPAFQRLSKNYPQDVVPKLWLAKAYIKQGGEQNFDQARNLLREVTTKSPQQGEAWALLGEVTRWDNSTRWESIQALQTALGMADEFEAVKSNQANLTRYLVEQLTWEGKYDEALPYAQSVHGQLEKDRSWLVTYANVLSHTGQANTAVTLFDEAVRPTDSDPLQWRLDFLTALRLSGQQEAAKRYYNQIEPIALEKTDPQVLSSLASAAYELGLYQRAVMVDEWLPADWQNRKDVALRQARALAKLDRAPEAINQFQSVYQQNQMTPWEKLEYGDYLLGLRLPANALPQQNLMETLYQQALADKPELESQVNLRLARVYKRNGQYFMKATEAYQTALGSAEGNARQQILPELLSFVQSNQTNPQAAEQVFEELMYQYSDDTNVKSAYAEFLSWQPAKRKQSVGLYSQLWQSDKQYSDQWQAKLTEVLSWHTPNAGWLKVYDGILAKKPDQQLEKQALISKAKALSGNPDTYPDAVKIISDLKDQYPDDADVTKEWLNVLMVTDPDNRQLAGELKTLVADNPDDIESKLALGRILSQRAQHRQAVKVFNDVLDTQPDNVDALVGKGYALLWGGKQFKAKKLLENVYADYPENPAVAMALASAYKQIGRNDKAIELLKKIRPLLNLNFQDSTQLELKYDFEPVVNYQSLSWQPCADFKAESQAKPPVMFYDFNNPGVVKNDNKSENLSPYIAPEPEELNSNAMVIPASGEITDAQRRQLIEEVYQLSDKLNGVKDQKTAATNPGSNQLPPLTTAFQAKPSQQSKTMFGEAFTLNAIEQDNNFASTTQSQDQFSNPYLTSSFHRLEDDVFMDMRPEFRVGFFYQTQDGNPTTNKLDSWGVPNQVSVALTPQVRLRGGIVPTRYFLQDSPIRPHSNFGWQYSLGATAQPTDKLTLDADVALTHFTQTGNDNFTYRAQANYAVNDYLKLNVGARRAPFNNSLLSVAGFRPTAGAFNGQVLGPVNENAFYGYATLFPIPQIDITGGYEWSFNTGIGPIPTSFKNQAYAGAGYTHRFNEKHSLRAGYEFLYFSFSKNATNGFFDVEAGVDRPLAVLRPVAVADSGYDFGGYFSPDWFVLNAIRLDYRGSAFKNFLEWKVGGSIGIQNFENGFGIQDTDPKSMATAFNVALTANLTKSIAAYGRTNFMDSGGLFQRWRFESGLIFRPTLERLMPIFGAHFYPTGDDGDRQSQEFHSTEHDRPDVKFYN